MRGFWNDGEGPSIPPPHAVGVAFWHLRGRCRSACAVADGAEHGDPVEQFAAHIAGFEHLMLGGFRRSNRSICCCSRYLITRMAQSGSGTPSERPGAMRGPPTSSEKLPEPMTTTRRFSGHDFEMARRDRLAERAGSACADGSGGRWPLMKKGMDRHLHVGREKVQRHGEWNDRPRKFSVMPTS